MKGHAHYEIKRLFLWLRVVSMVWKPYKDERKIHSERL